MSRRARSLRILGVIGALLLGVGLLAATALALPGVLEKPRGATLSVTQQGAVTGLYPGRTTTVTVVVRNASRTPVRVGSVTARPQASAGCPAGMLRVDKATSRKVLKPRRSVTVKLRAQLLRTAPDACQGRTFRLRLAATGRSVR